MNEKYLQTTKRALIGILSGFALFATTATAQNNSDVEAVAAGNTKFALKLYDQLNK